MMYLNLCLEEHIRKKKQFSESNVSLMEVPLDIRNGNIQAFYDAVMKDKTIDLILGHQNLGKEYYVLACSCKNLALIICNEILRLTNNLK